MTFGIRSINLLRIQAADGVLILNAAIEHPEEIIADLKERIVTFGLTEDADYSASDITYNEAACPSFTFLVRGQLPDM